jgi:hypothetical protein
VAYESNEGKGGKGKGEGSERDDGGTPIEGTEQCQAHPEVAVSAPGHRRFSDESRGRKNDVSKRSPLDQAEINEASGLQAKQPD